MRPTRTGFLLRRTPNFVKRKTIDAKEPATTGEIPHEAKMAATPEPSIQPQRTAPPERSSATPRPMSAPMTVWVVLRARAG